jgi:hypothetical protein
MSATVEANNRGESEQNYNRIKYFGYWKYRNIKTNRRINAFIETFILADNSYQLLYL